MESRQHEVQNPTSAEKIRLLGELLELGPESSVLDIASGKGGPARILAARSAAVSRVSRRAGVRRGRARTGPDQIEVVEADAKDFPIEPGDTTPRCASARPSPTAGSSRRSKPLSLPRRSSPSASPTGAHGRFRRTSSGGGWEDFRPLPETVARIESRASTSSPDRRRRRTTGTATSSLHWLALAEWLAANPDAPEAEEFRERGRRYQASGTCAGSATCMGWAIFVCRT